VFEVERIHCSDITGFGVRPFPDLVFEVERILHEKQNCKESWHGHPPLFIIFCQAHQLQRFLLVGLAQELLSLLKPPLHKIGIAREKFP
jgi:hypothetical protein